MDRRKIDVGLSALLITASVIILTNDNLVEGGVATDLGSLFLPRIIATLIIVFSATIGIQALTKLLRRAERESIETLDTRGFQGICLYIGIFFAYWFTVPYIGFMLATPFVMFAIAVLLGGRNWVPITLMSVITPVLVFYGAEKFLRVFLPVWSFS